MAEKYFHISHILSFITGRMMYAPGEQTAPDGTVFPYTDRLKPMIDITAHISGSKLWINEETDEYDGFLFMQLISPARASLVSQMPWLSPYNKDTAGDACCPPCPEGTGEEAVEFYTRWIQQVAARNGGKWFKVQGDALEIPPKKNTPTGLKLE